jgi:hypothetical protein
MMTKTGSRAGSVKKASQKAAPVAATAKSGGSKKVVAAKPASKKAGAPRQPAGAKAAKAAGKAAASRSTGAKKTGAKPAAVKPMAAKARPVAGKAVVAKKKAAAPAAPKAAPIGKRTAEVNAFMAALDHPFKAEVQAVREIIMSGHPGIVEQIKWEAPSFSYKGYLATFNLWAKQHVHLVFHNGAILNDRSGLLKGTYRDRRMAYFTSMKEVKAKRPALEKIVKDWVALMEAPPKGDQ